MADTKLSRNDPCPCGSGKKFKNCCLQRSLLGRSGPIPARQDTAYPKPTTHQLGGGRLPSVGLATGEPVGNATPVDETLDGSIGDKGTPDPATVPVLPVEIGLDYEYPEPFGTAEVSYILPAGRMVKSANGRPILNDHLMPGMRVLLQDGDVATITGVRHYYEPPDPPVLMPTGLWLSRVVGTIKHRGFTVTDVSWPGYKATGSPEHRYYSATRQAWVPAQELRVGEFLRTEDNLVTPVQAVSKPRFGMIDLYNLEVEYFHNYHVGAGGGSSVLVHNGTDYIQRPMEPEAAEQLPEDVLYRIERGDAKGRSYGTPRNPNAPTLEEFNPRIGEVPAGELADTVVGGKHGIFPEQAERVGQMSNEELIRFRPEDPISATETEDGLSLTGGHHRVNEIIRRVGAGEMDPNTIIRILIHD